MLLSISRHLTGGPTLRVSGALHHARNAGRRRLVVSRQESRGPSGGYVSLPLGPYFSYLRPWPGIARLVRSISKRRRNSMCGPFPIYWSFTSRGSPTTNIGGTKSTFWSNFRLRVSHGRFPTPRARKVENQAGYTAQRAPGLRFFHLRK